MIRVKICGITSPRDAASAAAAGADAIGLVFADSPRRVSPAQAAAILADLPPFVTPVALFVDDSPDRIRRICRPLHIRTVQLHGDEPPAAAEQLGGFCVIKAFRVGTEADLAAMTGYPSDACLLDSCVAGRAGGTGVAFDWQLAAKASRQRPLILAGGLNPENVAEAVRVVRPYAVDVSSGVETAPGRKDLRRMEAFVAAARKAWRSAASVSG